MSNFIVIVCWLGALGVSVHKLWGSGLGFEGSWILGSSGYNFILFLHFDLMSTVIFI